MCIPWCQLSQWHLNKNEETVKMSNETIKYECLACMEGPCYFEIETAKLEMPRPMGCPINQAVPTWNRVYDEYNLCPCPFCGNTESVTILCPSDAEILAGAYDTSRAILCNAQKTGCGAIGGWGENDTDAAEKWNKRVQY